MYQNSYLNRVYEELKNKYANEIEYLSAIEEFLNSMETIINDNPDIEKYSILERITIPERIITFRVSWVDDNNHIQVNNGYRVQFNSAIGPYKGGTRFDSTVNPSILKFLGFEQIFKNSLTGLPMGGAKGGSDFDPRGKSDGEIMRFCQAYIQELYPFIGPDVDVPAGDLGCGAREIGYMYGMYKKLTKTVNGAFTGKGLSYGGSLVRPESTGYGLCYFVTEMLNTYKDTDFNNKKVIVSGMGKVATYAALKVKELGGVVIAMSDRHGFIYDPNGLDVQLIKTLSETCKENKLDKYLEQYPSTTKGNNNRDIWNVKCDIALPCATQNEINLEDAKHLVNNGCILVAEGANMPVELSAIEYLQDNGVLFAPGKASNAGGVAVSGLEMSQNALRLSWSFEEVDNKLKEIMKNIFKNCYETALKYNQPTNLSLGANIAGFMKVYDAMKAEGVI